MSEANLTRSILRFLNSLDDCKAIKIHGSIYVEKGTPDIFCVHRTRPYLFEVKMPGKHPTEIQQLRMAQWGEAGAVSMVVRSVDNVRQVIGED